MKKSTLLLSALVALLTACTNDVPTINNAEGQGAAPNSYLSVNLLGARSVGRAPQGTYQNGTSFESNVQQIRFFFFDEDGAAHPVFKKNGTTGYNSYVDWYPTTPNGAGNPNQTVEATVNATIGVYTPDGFNYPQSVLAVVNPPADLITYVESISGTTEAGPLTGPSLSQLQGVVDDYLTNLADTVTAGNFVMTNSVYADNGDAVYATELSDDYFYMTQPEAEANPFYVYVERVLARVDLGISMTGTTLPNDTIIYPCNTSGYVVVDSTLQDQTEQIYVTFLGWNVTGTTSQSRLVKEISPLWPDGLFGNAELWNSSEYKRSYWALNPQATDFEHLYGSYSGEVNASIGNDYPANALAIPAAGSWTTTYLQENAAAYSTTQGTTPTGPEYPTKVIIAAQLVDANGQPYTVCQWNYKYYTLKGLQTAMAQRLNLYSRTGTATTGYTFTKIQPSDLTFATAQQLGTAEEETDADYYVYAILTPAAENMTWTFGNDPNSPVYDTDAANDYIRDVVNHAMIWNNGMTYYYFNIRHLGAANNIAYWGIVRNHIYATTISSVTGLGTPVYDPDKIIYPETPELEESVVNASVEILQWRYVSQGYDLIW